MMTVCARTSDRNLNYSKYTESENSFYTRRAHSGQFSSKSSDRATFGTKQSTTSKSDATVEPTSEPTTFTTAPTPIESTTAIDNTASTTNKSISSQNEQINKVYVATSGSDSGSGSETSPYRTIQNAINKAAVNATIVVRAGVYNEKLDISGKAGLSIVNYSGEMPILSGSGFTGDYLVNIAGCKDIKFSGFEITGFKANEFEIICIQNGSNNVEISHCKIHDNGVLKTADNAHMILAIGDTDTVMKNITISNNEIYNCATGWSESITVEGNVDGFLVSDNVIHDCTNIGIDLAGFYENECSNASLNQARNGIVSKNVIYNIKCPYSTCANIYVDGGRDIIIENNHVFNSMVGIEVGCENAYDSNHPSYRAAVSGVIVRNNLIHNNSEIGISIGGYDGINTGKVINTQIYNNTLYKNNCEINLDYCDNISINRNIIYSSDNSKYFIKNYQVRMATDIHSDDNIFYCDNGNGKFMFNDRSFLGLSEWQTKLNYDLNSKFINPLFVDPGKYNFTLQSASTVRNYGIQ
jgi:hypothetical protein